MYKKKKKSNTKYLLTNFIGSVSTLMNIKGKKSILFKSTNSVLFLKDEGNMAKAGERKNPFAKDHLIKTNVFLPMEPINTKTISFYIMYMAGILNRSGVDSLLLQSLRGYQHPEQNIS